MEKLKKAQECSNNGNYLGAKNYLIGVLNLDPNNSKAKELLAVCNNGGKPVTKICLYYELRISRNLSEWHHL